METLFFYFYNLPQHNFHIQITIDNYLITILGLDEEFVVFLEYFAVDFSHTDDKVHFSKFDLVVNGDFVVFLDSFAV